MHDRINKFFNIIRIYRTFANGNANGTRNGAQPQGQRRPQSGKPNGANAAAQGNRKPQDAAAAGKPLSEAARHQALPQTPIFAPKPGPRHMPKGPRNGSGGGGGRGR